MNEKFERIEEKYKGLVLNLTKVMKDNEQNKLEENLDDLMNEIVSLINTIEYEMICAKEEQ